MVEINVAEKKYIVERLPFINIVRTMKQDSKRHHYYCEETRQVTDLLRELRGEIPRSAGRVTRGERW
jgi:hypothetical protein